MRLDSCFRLHYLSSDSPCQLPRDRTIFAVPPHVTCIDAHEYAADHFKMHPPKKISTAPGCVSGHAHPSNHDLSIHPPFLGRARRYHGSGGAIRPAPRLPKTSPSDPKGCRSSRTCSVDCRRQARARVPRAYVWLDLIQNTTRMSCLRHGTTEMGRFIRGRPFPSRQTKCPVARAQHVY